MFILNLVSFMITMLTKKTRCINLNNDINFKTSYATLNIKCPFNPNYIRINNECWSIKNNLYSRSTFETCFDVYLNILGNACLQSKVSTYLVYFLSHLGGVVVISCNLALKYSVMVQLKQANFLCFRSLRSLGFLM